MDHGKAEKKGGAVKAQSAIPERPFYKIGEVCEMTDTQPYVLRFWETEFPQLAPRKSRSGQRIYEKRDVEMVLRIKKLLYDEEYTIAGARKKLDDEADASPGAAAGRSTAAPARKGAEKGAAKSTTHGAQEKKAAGAERRAATTLRALRNELRALKDLLES